MSTSIAKSVGAGHNIASSNLSIGGGGVAVTVTGLSSASLLLADAALSGGMQLVAATGTLPQRLTMTDDVYITSSVSFGGSGFVIDPNSTHFWTSRLSTPGEVRRFRISDGVIDISITGSTTDPDKNKHLTGALYAMTSQPLTNNRMWTTINTPLGFVGMIDPNNNPPTCEIFTLTGITPQATSGHVIEHVPGKILVRDAASAASAGQYYEYAYNGTGSANTCVYTGVKSPTAIYDAACDASGNVYFAIVTPLSFVKAAAATLTASATITPINATYLTVPGYGNAWRAMSLHSHADKAYIRLTGNDDSSNWFAVNLSAFTVGERVFGPVEFGNPVVGSSTTYIRDAIAYAKDGSFAVYATHDRNTANATSIQNVRTLRLGPQRARWTWTPGPAVEVDYISFSGMMNNDKGFLPFPAVNAWFQGERDKRWTRFYYSLDGGATRTEFQNCESIMLSVTAGQTVTIDAEMQVQFNNMNGTKPYLSDTFDEAAFVVYRTM